MVNESINLNLRNEGKREILLLKKKKYKALVERSNMNGHPQVITHAQTKKKIEPHLAKNIKHNHMVQNNLKCFIQNYPK